MRRMSRATPRLFTVFACASALCLPAAAIAAQFDYFIKLPPIDGDSGKGSGHGGEIEIQSFSWGATQTSHGGGGGGGGMGAGKVAITDNVNSTSSQVKREAGGTEDSTITAGKGTAAPAAVSHDLRTNVVARTAPPGAIADLDGDGRPDLVAPRDSASGQATGIFAHMPHMHAQGTMRSPPSQGSLRVRGKFPSCTVGTRYPSLEVGARAERYTLRDVVITSCGSDAMEEISFNYAKIET